MTVRQPLPVILAQLLPMNLVKCVWRRSGEKTNTQITGTVQRVNIDLVDIFPLQGHGRRVKTINIDRIHSVVVLQEGPLAARARHEAAHRLREAARHTSAGGTDEARELVAEAGRLVPGLLPHPRRED